MLRAASTAASRMRHTRSLSECIRPCRRLNCSHALLAMAGTRGEMKLSGGRCDPRPDRTGRDQDVLAKSRRRGGAHLVAGIRRPRAGRSARVSHGQSRAARPDAKGVDLLGTVLAAPGGWVGQGFYARPCTRLPERWGSVMTAFIPGITLRLERSIDVEKHYKPQ